MAKISIEFDTSNDAFDVDGGAELGHVLSQVSQRIFEDRPGKLFDSNGNSIGEIKIEY